MFLLLCDFVQFEKLGIFFTKLNVCKLYVLFFLDKLRKFTISDFPKQTHLGYALITLFFFLHPLIDPHFTKMFLCWLH